MANPGISRPRVEAFEPVIGLEFHVQLATASKMFCACATDGAGGPNTRTCPVCLGLPGALPVPNAAAIDLAVRAALALDAQVAPVSVFARKHYFYPDLPKGYQITQFDQPLATGGRVAWTADDGPRTVRLVRVHLEEDAGKSLHDGSDGSGRAGLDFNRSGVPLIEIVTEPDLRSARDAADAFRQLRARLVAIGVTDGNLERGSMRCDANVSVRPAGSPALGTRTEIKNLNSFRFLERALAFEVDRQAALAAAGHPVEAETRLWDEAGARTEPMRSKESSDDYRYFPEPDLPPLCISLTRLETIRAGMPETPDRRAARYTAAYGLGAEDAGALAADHALGAYFERVADVTRDGPSAARWVRGELTRRLHERGVRIDAARVSPDALARLIALVAEGRLSASSAKQVLGTMMETGEAADVLAAREGLLQDSDAQALEALVDCTLAACPDQVAQYRRGKSAVAGFLVGQVIKASGGRANPGMVDALVRARLAAGAGE